jgi:hypothetical protein
MECPAIPPPKSDKNATSKGYTCKVNDGKLHKGKRYCFRPAGENFSGYGHWDMRCAVDGVNGTKNSQGVDDGRVFRIFR